jgi:hypothetical protein
MLAAIYRHVVILGRLVVLAILLWLVHVPRPCAAEPVTLLQVPGGDVQPGDSDLALTQQTVAASHLSFDQYLALIRLAQTPQAAEQITAQASAQPLTLQQYVQLARLAQSLTSMDRIANAAIPLCQGVDDIRSLAQALDECPCSQLGRNQVIDRVVRAGASFPTTTAQVQRLTELTKTWETSNAIVLECTRVATTVTELRALQALTGGPGSGAICDQILQRFMEIRRPSEGWTLQQLNDLARLPTTLNGMNSLAAIAVATLRSAGSFEKFVKAFNECPCAQDGRNGVIDRVLIAAGRYATTVEEVRQLSELTKTWEACRTLVLEATRVARSVEDVAALQALVNDAATKDAILQRYLESHQTPSSTSNG